MMSIKTYLSLITSHISSIQQPNVSSGYHNRQCRYRSFLLLQKVLADTLLGPTDKRPPYHLTTVYLSNIFYFHLPLHTPTGSFHHRLCTTSKHPPFALFQAGRDLFPFPTFKAWSKCLFCVAFPKSHFPLARAETIAPTLLRLYICASGLETTVCAICLRHRITAP